VGPIGPLLAVWGHTSSLWATISTPRTPDYQYAADVGLSGAQNRLAHNTDFPSCCATSGPARFRVRIAHMRSKIFCRAARRPREETALLLFGPCGDSLPLLTGLFFSGLQLSQDDGRAGGAAGTRMAVDAAPLVVLTLAACGAADAPGGCMSICVRARHTRCDARNASSLPPLRQAGVALTGAHLEQPRSS